MTLIGIVLVALAFGAGVPGRRLLMAPALIGALGLVALAINGQQVSDTPIPFLILMTTLAILAGSWFRSLRRSAPAGRSGQ